MKCDARHYFHNECIEKHIELGNLNCPLCNARIDEMGDAPGGDDEKPEAMMEAGEEWK